jgi:hypothetical protein
VINRNKENYKRFYCEHSHVSLYMSCEGMLKWKNNKKQLEMTNLKMGCWQGQPTLR